jgi:MipA family protein
MDACKGGFAKDGRLCMLEIPLSTEVRLEMKKLLWLVIAFAMSFNAFAQPAGDDDADVGPEPGEPMGWGLGLGTIVKDSPYAGEGLRVMPIPLVSYSGERFYFRIGGAGWRIIESDSFELTAIGKLRFGGFNVDDLGRDELAQNGIDYRLLEDRDMAFDLGLGMKWAGKAGEFEVKLLTDATDTSGGQEISLEYGYPFQLGKGSLSPNLSVSWQSKDMANYYYGTLDKEVARGVVDYKPGAAIIPEIGLSYFRPLGEKWSMMAFFKYSILPDEIRDSPLIEADTTGTASIFVGISRSF